MKEEKGSIVLIVVVTMLFLVVLLVGIFISNTNMDITSKQATGQIKENYEKDMNNIDEVYQETVGKNKKYVQKGLILHYDGINNTGNGHSATATTWKDLSGNGNDGTLTNFNYTTGSGWGNSGLKFDGVDDIVITNSNGTNFSQFKAGVKFTYSATFTTGATALNDWHGIISNMASWGNGGFNIQYGAAQGIALGMGTYVNSGIVPNNNTTYTVDGVYDGANISIYVNGILKSTQAYSIKAGTSTLILSCFYTTPDLFTNGVIHNVKFYNRALSEQEIQNNYEVDVEKGYL